MKDMDLSNREYVNLATWQKIIGTSKNTADKIAVAAGIKKKVGKRALYKWKEGIAYIDSQEA